MLFAKFEIGISEVLPYSLMCLIYNYTVQYHKLITNATVAIVV